MTHNTAPDHVFNPLSTLRTEDAQRFMLRRHPQSPVLRPNPLHPWEALNVFNAAVVQHAGLFHMHFRAQGIDFVSSIAGRATGQRGVAE